MVPTDYRLDRVCARIIDRLEGARRSYSGKPHRALAAFEQIAHHEVEAAIREFREVAMQDHPETQARLLRREVLRTFLPRYTQLANEMNEREEDRFGFGLWGEPAGRVVLAVVALFTVFFCMRAMRAPVLWPLLLATLALPFIADIGAWLQTGRYRRRLEAMLDDMARIQETSTTWLEPYELGEPTEGGQIIHLIPPDKKPTDD